MMRRPSATLLATVIFAALLLMPNATPAAEAAENNPVQWSEADEGERQTIGRMLKSPSWPFRAIALLRLEKYRGPAVTDMLGAGLTDEHWQVRCFSLRQCLRMDIALTASDLANERDPRVLRTALRQGIAVPDATIAPIARRLMKQEHALDHVLLGIELAAASTDDKLKTEAARLVKRMIMTMNQGQAAYVSERLARLLGIEPVPEDLDQWRQWLNAVRGRITFNPAKKNANDPLQGTSLQAPQVFIEMDSQTFARLVDYLDVLAQRELDLVVVIDSTASMRPMINEARAGVDSLISFLSDISKSMRLGIVAYRDHDNPPAVDGHPLTMDIASIRSFLFNLKITGGADLPEAVCDGIAACTTMAWGEGDSRQVVLVGDAPPHDADVDRLVHLLRQFEDEQIPVHAVHVPMRRSERYLAAIGPQRADADSRFLADYNRKTSAAFAEIARLASGEKVTLDDAQRLVPLIMHFTIEEGWRDAFDSFYSLYLELCR